MDILIESKHLHLVLYILKKHSNIKANCLMDITAIDELGLGSGHDRRYRCIYSLLSVHYNFRINIHVYTEKQLDTVSDLFFNAEWLEREVWDMFGIVFINNKDLRRILSDYQFKGFALRKDFPVIGYLELFYFDAEARIVYLPVNLIQEIKQFKVKASW